MSEDTTPSAPADATAPAVAPTERTLEQVEAEWKNRLSGKDKAHAAEVAALRAEATKGSVAVTELERLKAEKATSDEALAAERAGRVIDSRKTQFPNAAQTLGDDILAQMPEDRLVALEQGLAGGGNAPTGGAGILANTAQRSTAAAPAREKSTAELKADLLNMPYEN